VKIFGFSLVHKNRKKRHKKLMGRGGESKQGYIVPPGTETNSALSSFVLRPLDFQQRSFWRTKDRTKDKTKDSMNYEVQK